MQFNCGLLMAALLALTSAKLDYFQLAWELRHILSPGSGVYLRGSPEYERSRPVHNGACRNIFPGLIVVPKTTRDVAKIVKMANKYGIEMSKRSGGHSFQCQGILSGSLHVDMRAINLVHQLSDHEVRLGAGATFEKVLKIVNPEKYTMIHGQALSVGVGGFVQGVGLNPMGMTHRHGYGADNVVQYTIVLADGSIAKVTKDNTTVVERDGHGTYEVYSPTYESDLHYGLRGAGGSLGIITEIIYRIYPRPDTLSCFLLVYIETPYDLMRLLKAAQDGRYTIAAFETFLLRRPKLLHLAAWALIKMPQMFKWKNGKNVEPTFVSLTDVSSMTRKTPAAPAIAFLKSHGLRVATDSLTMINKLGMDMVNMAVDDQESLYLTEDEYKQEGFHAMTSANMNGLTSFKTIQDIFFNHPIVGIKNRKTPLTNKNSGCDFCLWILHSGKPGVNDNVIQDTKIGPVFTNLDCTYNANDPVKARNCPRMVKKIKRQFVNRAKSLGESPHQYVNTPSCDKQDKPFGPRYWGNSYPRLLEIKKFWDPQNVFHHCQSLGSTDDNCCAV